MQPFEPHHLLARSAGLLEDGIRQTRVAVFGAGSVGSYLAEVLVRSGVGGLVLVDPEVVDVENVCRANFLVNDVGRPKVEAVERRLRRINPHVRVEGHARTVEELDRHALASLVRGVDLVVVAVDSNATAGTLCRVAYSSGTPAIHVGIWSGGSGGEVVLSVPPGPCYLCATAMRHQVDEVVPGTLPATNYGLGRVEGVNALVADIHHVASIAAKIGLGLLSPPGTTPARRLVDAALADGAIFLVVGNDLDYWAFPALLADIPGQYAFQSLWSTVEPHPSCPLCGDADVLDLDQVWRPAVSAEDLRAAR